MTRRSGMGWVEAVEGRWYVVFVFPRSVGSANVFLLRGAASIVHLTWALGAIVSVHSDAHAMHVDSCEALRLGNRFTGDASTRL